MNPVVAMAPLPTRLSLRNKEGLPQFRIIVKDPTKAIYRFDFGSNIWLYDVRIADYANNKTNSITALAEFISSSGVRDRPQSWLGSILLT